MRDLQFSRIVGALMLLLMTYTMLFTAIATDAAAQGIDVRPTVSAGLEWLAGALITVLTVLGTIGIRFVTGKIGLQNSELEASLVARLDEIIHKSIDYAYTTALNEVNKPGSGLAEVKFDNWVLSLAASYANTSAPGIIRKFQITEDRLRDMIVARLPAYLANLSPAGGLPSPKLQPDMKPVSADA